MFKVPEKYRVTNGEFGTTIKDGNNGAFQIRSLKLTQTFNVIISDSLGWEHVSISAPTRTPTWDDMCVIKDMFWDEEDLVVQFHPPKDDYINLHPHCLHLWRKSNTNDFCETPPKIMVGI